MHGNLRSRVLKRLTSLGGAAIFLLGSSLTQAQTPFSSPNPIAAPAAGSACIVSEFMGVGLMNHDPAERSAKAYQWLASNQKSCDSRKLQVIMANRANWMGTSDTPQMFAILNAMLEAKLGGNAEQMDKALGFSSEAPVAVARADEVVKVKIPSAGGSKPQGFGQPSPFGQPFPFGQPSPFGQPASPFGQPASPAGNPFAPK